MTIGTTMARLVQNLRVVAPLFLIAALLTPQGSVAQTASSVTPSSFAPDAQRLRGSVVFSGERGTKAPEGSDKLLITLGGLNLEGGLPEMAHANEAVRTRLTSGTLTVEEIFNAASDLELAYANDIWANYTNLLGSCWCFYLIQNSFRRLRWL